MLREGSQLRVKGMRYLRCPFCPGEYGVGEALDTPKPGETTLVVLHKAPVCSRYVLLDGADFLLQARDAEEAGRPS
jgi:hypothetical protein